MKMAVIRGTEARPAQTYFYNYFKKIEVKFIGHVINKNFYPPNKVGKIEYIQSSLKPAWLIDPAKYIYGKIEHHAWAYHNKLEEHIADCDILNITDCFYFFSRQAALLARKHNKPLVTIVWETFPKHPSTYIPPYCFNVQAVLKQTDLFIARNKMARVYLKSIGVVDRKIKLIYKGVDLTHFFPVKKKKRKTVRILYVGQLVKTKGVDDLLAAFKKLYKEEDKIELWICGTGLLKEEVMNMAKKLPINYLGYVDYTDLPDVFRQCDVFCSPSKDFKYFGIFPGGEEWFSYTLMEAMASGLVVVANDCGSVKEEIGKNNLLVEQGEIDGLVKALKKLIQNPSLREELSILNRLRAEKFFDAQNQARKTEKAILSVL